MKQTNRRWYVNALHLAVALLLGVSTSAMAADDESWMQEDGAPSQTVAQPAPQNVRASRSEQSNNNKIASVPLLKGGVTYCVPSGTPIKMKLATVPKVDGMSMLSRDLDGNLLPAKMNQPITAKTTEDIYVDDNKVIPQGTIFYGHVTKIFPPKRVGRPGSLVLNFDRFETPDGRKFAFHCEANNKKESTAKTKAKGFGLIMAHAAGGAVVGALIAYQIFGLQETIAMHGYNIAGGAAAGALAGTAVALMRHGPQAVLEPGDDLNMEIDTDLLVPAATAPTAKAPPVTLPGLDIHVVKGKVVKDGLEGYQYRLEAEIENKSNRRLQSIDLFIEDDNGARFPVVADAQEAYDIVFNIDPYSSRYVKCDFGFEYPKLKRKLVWLDHASRQPLYETKLP